MCNATPSKCSACGGNGWLLMMNADSAALELQCCDSCDRYSSDKEAEFAVASNESMFASVLSGYIEALLAQMELTLSDNAKSPPAVTRTLRSIRDSARNAAVLILRRNYALVESQSNSPPESPVVHSDEGESKKKRYLICVREVHVRHFEVEAHDPEEAKALVKERAPEVVDCEFEEYSHEMNPDTWSVEEKP